MLTDIYNSIDNSTISIFLQDVNLTFKLYHAQVWYRIGIIRDYFWTFSNVYIEGVIMIPIG